MTYARPPESEPNVPEVGDLLAGKYRVERVLGAGGMGVVVAAEHLELCQTVAVKFLRSAALSHEEAVARFTREARILARLHSEHVARVLDIGRLESGSPYMVMEYLEGQDLSARLALGPVSETEAVGYILQACDAIAEAHAAGVVHRDIKPANLYLTERSDGESVVKVLDFGISKTSGPELADASLTRTEVAMGSPLYMSPEQMRSTRSVDARADVWSLGAVLYELLAGRPPFSGSNMPDLVAAVLSDTPRPLREMRPELTAEVEQVVMRCLEKDRERRLASVAELASALAPLASDAHRIIAQRIVRRAQRSAEGPAASLKEARSEFDSSRERSSVAPQTEAERANGEPSLPVSIPVNTQTSESPTLYVGGVVPAPSSGESRSDTAASTAWAEAQSGSGKPQRRTLVLAFVAATSLLSVGVALAWFISRATPVESDPQVSVPVTAVARETDRALQDAPNSDLSAANREAESFLKGAASQEPVALPSSEPAPVPAEPQVTATAPSARAASAASSTKKTARQTHSGANTSTTKRPKPKKPAPAAPTNPLDIELK